MTNETKTQDDGYQELDVSKTTDKVEYELEDGGSPDKGVAPSQASEPKEASPSKSEDSYIVEPEKSGDENKELDGIETDGARKRINKLVKQRKEKEEALYAAQEQINQLQEKLEQSHKKTKDVEATNLINYEKQIQEKLKNSEELYKSAYDSGDKDKLLEAQKNIADATTELRLVGAKRWYYEDQKKEEKPATEAKQAPQQPKAKPNPLATMSNTDVVTHLLDKKANIIGWDAYCNAIEGWDYFKDRLLITGGTCAGMRSIGLLHTLGFRTIHLYGFDSCNDGPPKDKNELGEDGTKKWLKVSVGEDNKPFWTTGELLAQAQDFEKLMQNEEVDLQINVHGTGLIPALWNDGLRNKNNTVSYKELLNEQ